ncbi:hypothetical protein MG293_001792 [Ovis ammon polii]|uniref:Uncharacterized protein n=1 Tax=Ovis ammon polii TaxID=230172 RepID=A0AAD4YJ30_OVIAM|nr:hypothetical protein MG293_001792 [Ovis ammon polii]
MRKTRISETTSDQRSEEKASLGFHLDVTNDFLFGNGKKHAFVPPAPFLLLAKEGERIQHHFKRLHLYPWDSPGKNIGVGSHALLLGIFLTKGSNLGGLHCSRLFYQESELPGKPTKEVYKDNRKHESDVKTNEGSKTQSFSKTTYHLSTAITLYSTEDTQTLPSVGQANEESEDQAAAAAAAAAAAKSLQSCTTPCDPIDGSPPGSPIPGILQARTLERVAISFSDA